MDCKFLIKKPKSKYGGICGYWRCCPHIYNPEIICSIKTIAREYEERKGQQDPPTQEEIKKAERRR